jgi:DNA-binding Lrp family transcriptional regulator
MKQLKDLDYKIISALMKNSKISDRELAKFVGTSQPTVSRIRAKLEKENLITYAGIPNLVKLGYNILAFTFLVWKREEHEKLSKEKDYRKRIDEFMSKYKNIIFASSGRGLGMTRVSITIHKNYSDYVSYVKDVESKWNVYTDKLESFIVSLKSDLVLRAPTFRYFAEHVLENK